jgi:two-component system sensor histidine kinase KdpD
VAEDDPMVGDAFEEALRAGYNTVIRTTGVDDTAGRLGDGEAEVALLDVQLLDGTAWDALDRIPSSHPLFRVALVSAVDVSPPQRWAHLPLFRKPLDRSGLMRAVAHAAPYRQQHEDESRRPNWIEHVLLADAPALWVSVPVALLALGLVTLLAIPIRTEAFGAISACYTIVVLAIAAYAGVAVGLLSALAAFLAYNFFTVPPYYTLRIASTSLLIDLLVFLAAAGIGAVLVGTGRSLARRRGSDAALSRLRLRLISQTVDVPSNQQIGVITRVVKDSVSDVLTTALLEFDDPAPEWVPVDAFDQARLEHRTVEVRSGNQSVLLLPIDGNGMVLAVTSHGARINDQDRRLLGFAATELARVAERVELLKAAEATERLEARDEAKNALLAAVSHDLRTPLASMKVAVTTALEPDLELSDSQKNRLLKTVDSEVDRLGTMIDHLLDLSRLESGAFRLNQDQVDLALLTDDAADRVRLSSGRQIQVGTHGDGVVTGDAVRLLEVITNLIDNAARHSTPNTPIRVTVRPEDGSVTVAVTDEGPGLTKDDQEMLFRPFTRGTRAGVGSGLGLAITRSIVTAHHGTIDVVSSPGSGTTMAVTIPRRPLHAGDVLASE